MQQKNVSNSPVQSVQRRKLRCAVPENDVLCFVTKNINTDEITKTLVQKQIREKLLKKKDTQLAPKKTDRTSRPKLTTQQKVSTYGMKVNMKHFKKKKKEIDEIDVSFLEKPMRSSTPTPSIDGSTILAGNLDIAIDDKQMNDTLDFYAGINTPIDDEETDDDDTVGEIFQKYLATQQKKGFMTPDARKVHERTSVDKVVEKEKSPKIEAPVSYCKQWMAQEEGISTNNSDPPPLPFMLQVLTCQTVY